MSFQPGFQIGFEGLALPSFEPGFEPGFQDIDDA